MNLKSTIMVSATVLSVGLLCSAFVQHGRLQELRKQRQQREEQASAQPRELSNPAAVPQTEVPHAVPSELLKLRNAVSQLTRRRDELAAIGAENARLKAQLASRATNGPAASGYVRKAEAKFSGYDTPENTLQTFLWAIRNKDYETWLNTLDPEFSEAIRKAEQGPNFSAEKIFEGAAAIPGLGITSLEPVQTPSTDGTAQGGTNEEVSAQIQIGPDIPEQTFRFRRVAGQWKLALDGMRR